MRFDQFLASLNEQARGNVHKKNAVRNESSQPLVPQQQGEPSPRIIQQWNNVLRTKIRDLMQELEDANWLDGNLTQDLYWRLNKFLGQAGLESRPSPEKLMAYKMKPFWQP